MIWLIFYMLVQLLLVVGIISLGYFIYDKRYKRNQHSKVPIGFIWTEEVNIDPTSGEKQRVYFNPDTGERFYRIEK